MNPLAISLIVMPKYKESRKSQSHHFPEGRKLETFGRLYQWLCIESVSGANRCPWTIVYATETMQVMETFQSGHVMNSQKNRNACFWLLQKQVNRILEHSKKNWDLNIQISDERIHDSINNTGATNNPYGKKTDTTDSIHHNFT